MKTLEELFDIAQQYGNIRLYQSDEDRTFSITIAFMTISHTELTAKSGFKHETIEQALIAAITKAEEIINSLSTTVKKEYKLLN